MEIQLKDKTVMVHVIRKKIKNIYFRIDDNQVLNISVPYRISDKELLKLIQLKEKDLIKMYDAKEKKLEKNNEFWYLGVKYIVVYDINRTEVEINGEYIYVKNQDMLDAYVKKKTLEIFKEESEKLKQIIHPPEFCLKIRKMKTRWGVCNYKLNTITLNSELIRYRIEDLRYVIVHEMCHFFHHNHGKEFWKMVSIYDTNYKEARKDLKE